MKMFDHVISEQAVHNILMHLKLCWDYTYPTGKALEEAFYRGIKPFYKDVKSLGSPKTIVDVAKDKTAFDIKGAKKLGHLIRINKKSNFEHNFIVDVNVPQKGKKSKIKVRISKSVHTQVRRPPVDLKGYKGDPKKILNEQVNEYTSFAFTSTSKTGCEEIYSVVCQYGVDKGFKSVFLNLKKFSSEPVDDAVTLTKKDGTPSSYQGYNKDKEISFTLSSFNKGSSNLLKTFKTEFGVLFTWPKEEENNSVYTENDLLKLGAITVIE